MEATSFDLFGVFLVLKELLIYVYIHTHMHIVIQIIALFLLIGVLCMDLCTLK